MMELITQRDENEYNAHKMLEIFFRGYNGDVGLVSDDTLRNLKKWFGLIKEENRADVFVMFTNMLHKRHIDFDVKQFQI